MKITITCITFFLFGSMTCAPLWASESVSGNTAGGTVVDSKKTREITRDPGKRSLTKSKSRKINLDLAISADTVYGKMKQKQKIILIDVRRAAEFEKFRIPGSINISLFAVKTKVFLKSQQIVLVNEGHRCREIEQECKKLRQSGYEARFLFGGLNFWQQKAFPIDGDVFARRDLNKIPPRIFFAEKDYREWLAIDVSQTQSQKVDDLIPQSIHISCSLDPNDFATRLKAEIKKRSNNPFLSVLIFNEQGKAYESTEKLVGKTGLKNIFYMKGGLEAYERFSQQQTAIWQAKKNSTRVRKKCATCP